MTVTLRAGAATAALLLVVVAVSISASTDGHHKDHHVAGHHGEHHKEHHVAGHHGEHHKEHHVAGHHGEHHKEHHGAHHYPSHHRDTHHAKKDDDHEEEYQELTKRLNALTSRLHAIDEELDKRLDPEMRIKARSLLHRVETLEEDNCDKDHYDCGGFEPECVSKLMVCDGAKDCRNGGDEAHCELPTKQGDTFIGHVVFDHCSQRKPENMSFTITAVKTAAFFTAFPAVRALIEIEHEDDETEGAVALPTVGYYRFATQNLILLPPEDDRLGMICDFDGHNPDRCVGNIVRETSLKPCAQFIFNRKTDEDEEDEEDDD
jgi:hypothetical protein